MRRQFSLINAATRSGNDEIITGDWTFLGSVGIGTSTPIEALDVVGNVRTDRLILSRGGAGVEEPYIEKTGNKGIGFFTQATVKLDISVGGVFDFQAGNLITTGAIFAGGLTLTTGNLVAGTIDADFDALTATSYGGIAEANLLDKSASEVVGGDWDFSGNINIYGGSGLTVPYARALYVFDNDIITAAFEGSHATSSAIDIDSATGVTDLVGVRLLVNGIQKCVMGWDNGNSHWRVATSHNAAGAWLSVTSTAAVLAGSLAVMGDAGFYATAPIAKQTGVPVTAAGVHAALVNLGLIT